MILIAHRGNINGPNTEKENHPDYITNALRLGFDVEVDAWIVDGKIFLGHDAPLYDASDYFQYKGKWEEYNGNFVESPALWIHCKNFEALNDDWFFCGHRFTHNEDDFALTSTGYIWTYPRLLPLGRRSIAVMIEKVYGWDFSKASGICSDYISKYKND